MKRKSILLLIFFCLSIINSSIAQNALINEFISDPTMWDGNGGEYIELYCPTGGGDCDISCWVLSDAQGLITIPNGTTIPEGDFYLIAHEPSLSCANCDFFGIPVDLDLATCGCLTGGYYGVGTDGTSTVILGQGGNSGEVLYLLDDAGALIDPLKFDNASQNFLPTGGTITSVPFNACTGGTIALTNPNNAAVVNVGAALLGCNTSYMRSIDGGSTWITDNHPTPGRSNVTRGDAAFDYYYRVDGGAWTLLTGVGTNDKTTSLDFCDGDSIQFRVSVRNYQHVLTTILDASGRAGSYFQSTETGLIDWPIVTGLGTVEGEDLNLYSNNVGLNTGTYVLQWSDYKESLGSFSLTSNNECYERLTITLTKETEITSATVNCTDPVAGLSQVETMPANVSGLTYTLYDDIGDQSNPVRTNTNGLFLLGTADAPVVGYYIIVTGPCNTGTTAITASNTSAAFCRADPPCPEIRDTAIAVNGVICGISSSSIIFTEDFEGAQGVGYTANNAFVDAITDDYFDLINEGTDPVSGVPAYTGASGIQFWAAEDTDDNSNPDPSGVVGVTLSGINISSLSNIEILGLFAAGSSAAYESIDYMQISAQVDGGGFNLIGAFESTNGGGSTSLSEDTNLDGDGDGTILSSAFQDFTFALGATGASLDIQIEIYMSAGVEAVAFDNIRVQGVDPSSGACTACPSDTIGLFADGLNLPGGGTIDWYSSSSSTFDPYSGEGTYLGSVSIPVADTCSSSSVVINEVMYRPTLSNGNDPNTGEYIELMGPPGTDISCYVLTDGDWTITIPAGTTIPGDGIFSIGNDAIYGAGTFDLDAESCGCFTDGFGGIGLLIFTDAGEYVSIFDASGTFLDGVVYGSPVVGTNDPPNGANTTGGVINTVGAAGCPASVTIPGAASFDISAGGASIGTSIVRLPDGAGGTWGTQTGGSVNLCNTATPLPPIDTFKHALNTADCDQTIYYKGIINPYPNTVSCPNTASSASTTTFMVTIDCPEARLVSNDTSICSADAPFDLLIQTTGIPDATDVTINYTVNGAAQTASGTVNSNFVNLSASQSGTYALESVSIDDGSLCTAEGSDTTVLQVITTPNAPLTTGDAAVCTGTQALITASGSSGDFEWSFDAGFATIEGTGVDFLATPPATVFVRGVNTDGVVTCVGASSSVNITSITCPDITYPITLVHFYAKPESKTVHTYWQTATEENNDYFILEHSKNAIDFEFLAQVDGAGTTTDPQFYDYIHLNPEDGWNYYRLTQVDFDGTRAILPIATAYFGQEAEQELSLQPNPVEDELNISFKNPVLKNTKLRVFNSVGIEVHSQALAEGIQNLKINTEDWPSAVYYVQVENNMERFVEKVVKE